MAILTPNKETVLNSVLVKEFLLTKNNPNKIAMPASKIDKLRGITIHNTGWINVSSRTTPAEQYTRATYNGNMKDVRVHFYVDNVCAWQNLPLDSSGWHAADGNGDGNRRTIAIECIMKPSATDPISAKSEDNCAKLAAYLLHINKMTVEENLFTHTHWLNVRDGKRGTIDYLNTTKNSSQTCPLYILPHWDSFKAKVKGYLNKLNNVATPTTPNSLYRVRKTWANAQSQLGAFANLENAKRACTEGYSVFDSNGQVVYTTSQATPAPTPVSNEKIDVFYRAFSGNKWWGEIKNYENSTGNGYAGVNNYPISGIVAKASKGALRFRVHLSGGRWLGWIEDYNINDWNKGVAGIKGRSIDAIQMELVGVPGYQVRYRVSPINNNRYLNWITGWRENSSMGYAGIFNQPIDRIQIEIVKI